MLPVSNRRRKEGVQQECAIKGLSDNLKKVLWEKLEHDTFQKMAVLKSIRSVFAPFANRTRFPTHGVSDAPSI